MYQIIDKRGSGKTSRLMLLAKENNGILVCQNPYAMKNKAQAYGFTDLTIISYKDFFERNYELDMPCFIDELDCYVKTIDICSMRSIAKSNIISPEPLPLPWLSLA